jgi:hypothetical protein
MSYHKVIYEKLFPYAPYLNERIGIEILVETGQSPEDCLKEAKEIVDKFYASNLPQSLFPETHSIVADNAVVPIVDIKADEPPPTKLTKEEQQKKYLTDCTTIEELNTFKLLVKNNPHLQETFDNHLNFLTNK